MRGKNLSPERRLYRLLGIPLLKRLVLRLERRRHRRDGGFNENYHLAGVSVRDFRRLVVYLKLNTLIHVADLLLVAVYFLAYGDRYPAISLLMGLLVPANLWCILLQRDHYLALREVWDRMERRRRERARAAGGWLCLERLPGEFLEKSRGLMARIRETAEGQALCLLTEADATVLRQMAEALEPVRPGGGRRLPPAQEPDPFGKMENKLRRISRRLGLSDPFPRGGLLFETPEAASAFREVFPAGTEAELLYVTELWEIALKNGEGEGR